MVNKKKEISGGLGAKIACEEIFCSYDNVSYPDRSLDFTGACIKA